MRTLVTTLLLLVGLSGWAQQSTLGISYGRASNTNRLLSPSVFRPGSDWWQPIKVSGAGVAGANGLYYLVTTNADGSGQTAHSGYGVWSNSSGGDFYIFFNNTNLVPGSATAPFWTIQSAEDDYYYNTVCSTPFSTWDTLGGADPLPYAGLSIPPLVAAANAFNNGTITLSPGVYDIWEYTFTPTNLMVVADGATISGRNLFQVVKPVGAFTMYGGVVSNYISAAEAVGSTPSALAIDWSTKADLHGVRFFGNLQAVGGTVSAWTGQWDGCFFESYHDGINVVGGATSIFYLNGCSVNCINNNFVINGGMAAEQPRAVSFAGARVYLTGCVIRGINGTNDQANAVNTTCAIECSAGGAKYYLNGTVLDCSTTNAATRSPYKILVSNGQVIINGHPYDDRDILVSGSGSLLYEGITNGWRKETIFGSAITNGGVTLGSYFHCDLYSRNAPWAVQNYTNSVINKLPRYGYLSNLTVGVGTPFAATTNIVFCIKTNYIGASGAYLGLGDSALKATLRGSVTTPTFTNLSGVGVALTADAVGVMEIVPSAALQVTTNFWWSFEHWYQDNQY